YMDSIFMSACANTSMTVVCAINLRPCSPTTGLQELLCREDCEDMLCEGCPWNQCASSVCTRFPTCNKTRTCEPKRDTEPITEDPTLLAPQHLSLMTILLSIVLGFILA